MRTSDECLLNIVIPVHDTEWEFLGPCLESVTQDIDDYRVTIVDDGSGEETRRRCRRFVSKHSDRCTYVQCNQRGPNAARNAGVRSALSRWVIFLDSDDRLVVGTVPLLIERLRRHEPDLLFFDFTTPFEAPEEVPCADVTVSEINRAERLSWWGSLAGVAIATRLLKEHALFEGCSMGEDVASILPILAHADRCMELQGAGLYVYTPRASSLTHSPERWKALEIVTAFDHLLSTDVAVQFAEELEWQAIRHLLVWESIRVADGAARRPYVTISRLRRQMSARFPAWKGNHYLVARRGTLPRQSRLLVSPVWPIVVFLRRRRAQWRRFCMTATSVNAACANR